MLMAYVVQNKHTRAEKKTILHGDKSNEWEMRKNNRAHDDYDYMTVTTSKIKLCSANMNVYMDIRLFFSSIIATI